MSKDKNDFQKIIMAPKIEQATHELRKLMH